ncbi:hypothetical protein [Paenibacillus sp. L3-i20]|uniref:hypothetical protein n=1 Tax=Paenibacillus sp. L3-i20 TaxID=2905833 RepID=UPI001EDEC290|nr:hypothetical protein [Paenibacillus sp. L3-i20]GKU79335.1 hypothetical protein L3i20_v237320 [Paenibacillus sp. L3-i20]
MCIICEIGKAVGATEVKVGVVSPQLREEFMAISKDEALAELDVKQLVLNGRRSYVLGATEKELAEKQAIIDAKSKSDEAKFEAVYDVLWDRVHAELPELDRERNYSIDAETGEITNAR